MEQGSGREKKQLETAFPFVCWNSEFVSFPYHWHDCFEILLVGNSGKNMYASVEDTMYEVFPGDIILINSGAAHGFLISSPGSHQGFQFGITIFDESFINLRDIVFQNPVLGRDAAGEQLRRLAQEIVAEYNKRTIGYQLAIKSKLYELMLILLRNAPGRLPKPPSSKSKRMLAFVLKNADDPDLTLEAAAEALGLNKFYFSHFFKKNTGQSFHSHLVKTRVNFAKHYLAESKMPIIDVAFQSGFNSVQTFNRVFKSQTGFTPGNYRRETAVSVPTDFEEHFCEKTLKKSNN